MSLTISFPGTEQTTLAEVGGKGFSLIRMVEAGVPVPPGAGLRWLQAHLPKHPSSLHTQRQLD